MNDMQIVIYVENMMKIIVIKKIERARKYYHENKEHHKEYKKEYRKKNHDAILQYNKKYYEKNKERCAKYFQENKEKINKVRKLFLDNNPDRRILLHMRTRLSSIIHDIATQFEVTTTEYKKLIEHKGFRELLDCDQDFFCFVD